MRDTTWATVGTEVAVLGSRGWSEYVQSTDTVAKVGVRDITLASGKRFRVADGTLQGVSGYSASSLRIVPADDPRVAEIEAAERAQQRMNDARRAVEQWDRNRESENGVQVAVQALVDLLPADHPMRVAVSAL